MLYCVIFEPKAGGNPKTSLTGITVGPNLTGSEKIFHTFQALGNIAFAYGYSQILIEIQASLETFKEYLLRVSCFPLL